MSTPLTGTPIQIGLPGLRSGTEQVPAADGPQIYVVARGLRVEHFSDFGDFASRVNALLNGGSNMRALTARGVFDQDTTTLEANYVAVSFPAQ